MSMFSGKCDLYDHIGGLAGWYDRDGNPVKMGDGCGAYYSDEYKDFLEFKKRTGGVLHQHKKVKVTEWNQNEVAEKLPEQFEIIAHAKTIPDKRHKSGEKTVTTYTYKYWGKEYKSLHELNKHGVYITLDIHFDTILDLIPYYPYLVSAACCDKDKQTVFITSQSFVDSERDERYERGCFTDSWEWYHKKLQEHYKDIVLKYFNPTGREHVEEVEFGENGIGYTIYPIDENFRVEWRWADGTIHTHWTSPKVLDKSGMIQMSKEDIKMIGRKMLVYYVEAKEYPLDLG